MSSTKRRKLDLQQTPSCKSTTSIKRCRKARSQCREAAVSAVSALAARRRQAAGAADDEDTPSPAGREDTPSSNRANPFSVLQGLRQQNDASKPPYKGSPRPRRDPKSRGDIQRASADNTTEAYRYDFDANLSFVNIPLIRISTGEIQDPESSTLSSQLTQYSSFRLTKRNHRQKSSSVTELRLEDSEVWRQFRHFSQNIVTDPKGSEIHYPRQFWYSRSKRRSDGGWCNATAVGSALLDSRSSLSCSSCPQNYRENPH